MVLLGYWYELGGGNNPTDMVVAACIALALAAIDAGAVRYLLQAIRRVEETYASDVSEELERALESYRSLAEREAQLAQEIGRTVGDELEHTREALAEGHLEEADEHMQRGLRAASKTRAAYCDNVAVAAVLEVKARQCEESGVRFSAQASVPEDLPLPETEVAAVLFNLIDNALRECEGLVTDGVAEAPEITVRAKAEAGQLFVEVANPCKPESGKRLRISALRRPDAAREHGWGTHIVDDIVGAHGGVVSRDVANGTFVVRVMIPLPERTEEE